MNMFEIYDISRQLHSNYPLLVHFHLLSNSSVKNCSEQGYTISRILWNGEVFLVWLCRQGSYENARFTWNKTSTQWTLVSQIYLSNDQWTDQWTDAQGQLLRTPSDTPRVQNRKKYWQFLWYTKTDGPTLVRTDTNLVLLRTQLGKVMIKLTKDWLKKL